jgi:hypothetical protein
MHETKSSLTPGTIFRFLLFGRDAILKVASSKSAFWIGLLFVVGAGFAREYDGEYLIAEPWHLILPLAASLIGCGFMVVLIYLMLLRNGKENCSFAEVFRSFLNVYWMTAPLALLYGIPVERFFDPGGATQANLILLAIVAVWRVLLMIRCVYVLSGASIWRSIVVVLLFSDILAMLALYFVPGPIFMIMGGVRLTESEQLILDIRIWSILLCYGSILVWVIGYLITLTRKQPLTFYLSKEHGNESPVATRSLWWTAPASILLWIPFLFFTQPEQSLRWQGEQLIKKGKFKDFGLLTADVARESFPPHWDPPPRVGYGERKPHAFKVLNGLLESEGAPWAVAAYTEKFHFEVGLGLKWHIYEELPGSLNDDDVEVLVDLLSKRSMKGMAARLYRSPDETDFPVSDRRKELLERLEEIATIDDE